MKNAHGGDLGDVISRFGFAPSEILDLSTGIAPRSWPVPPSLLNPADWQNLPQKADEEALKESARVALNLADNAHIALAPGSQILINLVAQLRPAHTVMIPDPAYAEHASAWRQAGHDIIRYPAGNLTEAATRREGCSLVAVQPGNPLGEVLAPADLAGFAERLHDQGGLVIVDEAFADLMPAVSLTPMAGMPGLIVLRSFGKFYGLAGLRLGLALGHEDDMQKLENLMGPWAVSTPALRIGAAALADQAFQDAQRHWLQAEHDKLVALLQRHQIKPVGGTSLYVLAEVENARALQDHLAAAAIWTRVFERNDRWIRFGLPGDDQGFDRLDQALASFG